MTSTELGNEYLRIIKKDTTLDAGEQVALLNQFIYAWDAADIGLLSQELQERLNRLAGVLDFLQSMGKIQDDEDLWMLMNEIEKYGYGKAWEENGPAADADN